MAETSRFGLEKVSAASGGSISDNGGKYTSTDRDIIDKVLAALEVHHHDGGNTPVALASPTVAATTTSQATGGQIGSGTRYYVYSLVDQFGLETAYSPEVSVTIAGIDDIEDTPVITGDTVDGSQLAENTYYYALTGNTPDGETTLGPESVITIQTDQNQADLVLPDLPTGITSWNVWRQAVNEDGWTKVGLQQPAGDFIDVGFASGDCLCDPTTQPPDFFATGVGSGSIIVTPGSLTGATAWKLYESDVSGSYGTASLVATVVPTTVGAALPVSYTDTGAALLAGQPLIVSTTLKPSRSVSGGGGGGGGTGGGGADSHLVYDTSSLTVPASGTAAPIYYGDALQDRAGYDLQRVFELADDGSNIGDEIQVNTSAVYGIFIRAFAFGLAPNDALEMRVGLYGPANQFQDFLPKVGQAICGPGQTLVEGSFAMVGVYLEAGTRIAATVKPLYAGDAPAALAASLGVVMQSGTPRSSELYPPLAAATVVDAGTGGAITVSVSMSVDETFQVLVYDTNGVPVTKASDFSVSPQTITGLTDDQPYVAYVIARKFIDGVAFYSTPTRVAVTPTSNGGGGGGGGASFTDDFSQADGTVLAGPNWSQGGAPGSLQTLGGTVINQGGQFGPRFAMHDTGAANKALLFTHTAVANKTLVIWLAASDAEGGNPSVSLAIKGDGSAPSMTYNDGSGNQNSTLSAASGSSWPAYDGSSMLIGCQILGTTVQVFNQAGLAWSATIPAPVASTMAGFGLFANGGSLADIAFGTPTLLPGGGGSGTPFDQVQNLAVSNLTASGFTLTWNPSGAGGDDHYWLTIDGANAGSGATPAGVTTKTYTGLAPSTAYHVGIYTVDALGNYGSVQTITVTTTAAVAFTPSDAHDDAPELPTATGSVTWDNTSHTDDPAPYNTVTGWHTSWVKFTCTTSGTFSFDVAGFPATGYSGLNVYKANGDTFGGTSGTHFAPASDPFVAGTTYYILVLSENPSTLTLTWSVPTA